MNGKRLSTVGEASKAIAVAIRFFDHSPFVRLILLPNLQELSDKTIAFAIRSVDPSLFAQLISLPQCGSVRLSGLVGNSKLVKGEEFLAVFF